MDNEQHNLESQEELNAEKEAFVEVPEETLREKLAEQLGLDPDEQSDILDRAVKLKQEDSKRLSKAIEQKRKYREQLFSTQKKSEAKPQASNKETPDIDALVNQKFNERMEQRDLESLDLPDELKEEVKRVAKYEGISVREAAKNSYILHKKQEYEKAERIRNATPTRNGGSKYLIDPSKPPTPSDLDLSTEEGRKEWQARKEAFKRAQQNS